MQIDPALQARLEAAFAPLNREAAVHAFSEPRSLTSALIGLLPVQSKGLVTTRVPATTSKMFTTAAVNIWLRGVHSFLISASLTDVSPIWACVAGYYSSHYSVRAVAHVLGYFHLFRGRKIVHLEFPHCSFIPKKAGDREHQVYWKLVKSDRHFAADDFFTDNNPTLDDSDVAHRDWANYVDHLPQLPEFRPLNANAIKIRIEKISAIEFSAAPIPRVSKYPDVDSVQIIAYHRLVRFRAMIDTVIGPKNRFWSVHRNPPWARPFMDFQLTEQATLRSQFTL